ncbi:MAG TPA: flagellar motor protein MotB [Thermodesulfovibrionales bacterium]|nr:flagellar motor protein MotB [Thermodesulfovibrionales bacterium]
MKEQRIIIKKIKKTGHGGHHGGSWKVAYADFVTALMAFFLLLWLITMIAPEKRARVSAYFKRFSIFQQSGSSFMEKSSEMFDQPGEDEKKATRELLGTGYVIKPQEIKETIRKAVEERLGDIKDQVIIDVFEGGVRIQLVDKEGKPMFNLGASTPTPLASKILQVIGDSIGNLPNPVAIEGHTDSLLYKSSTYGNWELSTERALAARKLLEQYGLDPARLTRVAGFADTLPFIKEDPKDPRNRRISIILMTPKKDAETTSPVSFGIPRAEIGSPVFERSSAPPRL